MNTEKLSINVNIVDLGKIELLLEKGIYTNKTDFMIKAINNELMKNENIINKTLEYHEHNLDIGIVTYDLKKLLLLKNQNIKIDITVLGRLCFKNDVSLELVKETVNSVSIFGVFKASEEIKTYFNKK